MIESYLYDPYGDNILYSVKEHKMSIYDICCLLGLQDALDEVPNADPYERLIMYKNQFGDIVVLRTHSKISWPCAYIEKEQFLR